MSGLAMRMATGLGLHQSGIKNERFPITTQPDWGGYPGSQEVIDEESRRNTFWLIWAIDMTCDMLIHFAMVLLKLVDIEHTWGDTTHQASMQRMSGRNFLARYRASTSGYVLPFDQVYSRAQTLSRIVAVTETEANNTR